MGTDSEPNVHNGGVNLHPYTQEIKDYIVAQHNYARAFLTPSDAANMRQLKWNEALAIEASEHVNSCVFAHETEDYTYGQNLMYGNPQIDKPTVDRWIQAWVTDELSPSDRQGTGYLDLDHASAVLWATSYYVGCASNLCPKSYLTACNYYTPGNWASSAQAIRQIALKYRLLLQRHHPKANSSTNNLNSDEARTYTCSVCAEATSISDSYAYSNTR
ncbi:hypothetical protein Poli38472_003801 [Pythium oligandrum]|uniref:SCP domain-containing protein n=1 Tax=Pythium oligandrum TaxID=41045 RepID=A0A8K1CLW4_PYTOL|nr:hypothetical protein Poli38472_003801 [Pythium oligandrum]|eukprot:TMW66036.1 hypothetical protein Poli38472_003801 [Pythium oligandrum]